MLFKKNIFLYVIAISMLMFVCLVANAADNDGQILTKLEEILKTNPVPAAKKLQIINMAQDDAGTYNIVRILEGAEVKPHFHKTHAEFVYVIKGNGQQMVANGKQVSVGPGTVHFNPAGEIHALKNTGREELIILSIFTPAMKAPDLNFVQ